MPSRSWTSASDQAVHGRLRGAGTPHDFQRLRSATYSGVAGERFINCYSQIALVLPGSRRDTYGDAGVAYIGAVSPDGHVRDHADLGARDVLVHDVDLRDGKTWYTTLGDGPFVVGAALALLVVLVRSRRRVEDDGVTGEE